MSQIEITRELQIPIASISFDMQYLRKQAKESIKDYVAEFLPEQYQICLIAFDSIIKHAFEISEVSDDNTERSYKQSNYSKTLI